MIDSEFNDFSATLCGCMGAVGRVTPQTATVEVFWMKLAGYDLSVVKWALVESTDKIENGYDYNVKLIIKTIEKQLNRNKFRSEAILKLAQQDREAEERQEHIESPEYADNQEKGRKAFESCKDLLNDI